MEEDRGRLTTFGNGAKRLRSLFEPLLSSLSESLASVLGVSAGALLASFVVNRVREFAEARSGAGYVSAAGPCPGGSPGALSSLFSSSPAPASSGDELYACPDDGMEVVF